MNENQANGRGAGATGTWPALLAYAAAGWATVEILLGAGERFGLPQFVDRIVLGMFLAGFVATVLLLKFRTGSSRSPLVRVAGVFAITLLCSALALGLARWLAPADSSADVASIAVMPCDYKGDPAYAYLGAGLAEEVHARLARTSSVHVPSSRSVRKAMEATADRAQLAHYLNVEHLTACHIQQTPDHVSMSAEVMAPASRKVVWSGEFQYASVDPVSLVSDLTNSLVSVMANNLDDAESGSVRKLPTANRAAYESYVRATQARGREWTQRFQGIVARDINSQEFEEASRHYRSAIERDPGFATAYAGLAMLQASYFDKPLPDPRHREAKAMAEKALQLSPCEVEALITLSYPWVRSERPNDLPQEDLAEIKRLVDKAVKCEPGNVDAWRRAGGMYQSFQFDYSSNVDKAMEQMGHAITRMYELDPTDCGAATSRIEFWGNLGPAHDRIADLGAPADKRLSVADTIDALRTIMVLDPKCGYGYPFEMHLWVGEFAEAIAWARKWRSIDPLNADIQRGLAQAYIELGLLDQAGLWECRAKRLEQQAATPDDCESRKPRPDVEPQFSGNFEFAVRAAEEEIKKARDNARNGEPPYRPHYVNAIGNALWGRRPDLAAKYLEEGLHALGSSDPADLMFWKPKRTFMGRAHALDVATACRAAGREADARRMIELGRRVPNPNDPEVWTGPMNKMLYLDAWHRILIGDKAEAMRLTRQAVQEHQGFLGWFLPSREYLMLDPALEPLRKDSVYGPQLQQLVEEYEAWLAPARKKVLETEVTGDWESLRVL